MTYLQLVELYNRVATSLSGSSLTNRKPQVPQRDSSTINTEIGLHVFCIMLQRFLGKPWVIK